MSAAGVLVTGGGWLVAGGLAIGGVGVLAAVLGMRGSLYAGSQDECTAVDRFATYASPPSGPDAPVRRCAQARVDEEGDGMASEDTRHEFDQIVERLTHDYPSLGRPSGLPWPRPVTITVLTVSGVVWALLSMAMVAWGWRGVALTGAVGAGAGVAALIDTRRRRALH